MGFVDDKKEVVNSVALFEVLGNLPKTKSVSSLESVNSPSLNLMKFLLDLFVVTCNDGKNTTPIPGKITYTKCDVKRILIDILIEFFPKLVTIIKQAIKEAIKAGLVCGTNFKLPNTNARVSIEMKNLDINGLTKIDPNTPIGSTFYGKDATKDFNRYLSDLAQISGILGEVVTTTLGVFSGVFNDKKVNPRKPNTAFKKFPESSDFRSSSKSFYHY